MTLPLAPLAMALQGAVGAASIAAQVVQANQQAAMGRQQQQNILAKQAQDNADLQVRRQQETQSASQEIEQNDRRARSALATAEVAADTAGVRGISVDALLADLQGQQGRFTAGVNMQLDNTNMAITQQMRGAATEAQSNLNSIQRPTAPDYLGTALRTGAGVLGAYDQYRITPSSV